MLITLLTIALLCFRQTSIQHQTMENLHRLLQLFAHCRHCWWKDLLLPRWTESWPAEHGTDTSHYASHRCPRYRCISGCYSVTLRLQEHWLAQRIVKWCRVVNQWLYAMAKKATTFIGNLFNCLKILKTI